MKRIFLSLFAALITILGISAQNTYNMVIEMNDGTKINIGPNDIKNMSFMDGNLTVSGESIDDIKKEIAELKKKVDEQKSCECSKEIEALKQEIATLNTSDVIAMINVLQMQVKSLTDEVAALKANGGNNDSQGGGNDKPNEGDISMTKIIGVWEMYRMQGYETTKGPSSMEVHDLIESKKEVYEFFENGSLQYYYYENHKLVEDGSGYKYKIDGDKLIILHGSDTENLTIKELTDSSLIISDYVIDDLTKKEYYRERVLKRL